MTLVKGSVNTQRVAEPQVESPWLRGCLAKAVAGCADLHKAFFPSVGMESSPSTKHMITHCGGVPLIHVTVYLLKFLP